MVVVERPGPGDVGDVVDLWVELATGQREFGSHLYAEANRDVIRSQISRSLVIGELLVARPEPTGDDEPGRRADDERNGWTDGEPGRRVDDERDGWPDDGSGGVDDRPADDDILGFVMYGPESGSYQQDVSRGTVHNIYVRESQRNRGIGSDLLDAAESALIDAGVEVVSIGVMAGNVDAQRLYRRRGYHPHRVELEKDVETETTNHSSENE